MCCSAILRRCPNRWCAQTSPPRRVRLHLPQDASSSDWVLPPFRHPTGRCPRTLHHPTGSCPARCPAAALGAAALTTTGFLLNFSWTGHQQPSVPCHWRGSGHSLQSPALQTLTRHPLPRVHPCHWSSGCPEQTLMTLPRFQRRHRTSGSASACSPICFPASRCDIFEFEPGPHENSCEAVFGVPWYKYVFGYGLHTVIWNHTAWEYCFNQFDKIGTKSHFLSRCGYQNMNGQTGWCELPPFFFLITPFLWTIRGGLGMIK